MKLNVYQIYFEEEQKRYLSPLTHHYFNEKLSPFFENDVIRDLYETKKIHESDYFGIVSWRIEQKNGLSLNLLKNITEDYNFYGFNSAVIRHHVLPMGSAYHQHFGILFTKVLQHLGIRFNDVAPIVTTGFYQNAVIAHRDIYLDYVENWLLPSMKFIETCDDLQFQQLLRADPMYTLYPAGRREKLMEHLGIPHYPYHTFVLERLWSVYYQLNQPKIRQCLL